MSTKKPDNNKPENDIRISMNSRPRYVIKYALSILKEKNFKELIFSAVGGSIGRLLEIVEVLKIKIPDGVKVFSPVTVSVHPEPSRGDGLCADRMPDRYAYSRALPVIR